ncbi:MAG: ubiquinol-cytochrome c reductase iron-sulfur subunit [Elusimicrobia bacterium]|nr:ubiquinol-cytochrome c reductase iron-sulfur subunit [Elusimicrobiota bacterium]
MNPRRQKEQRIWVVRTENQFYVLWARCTHLGCTPNWFAAEGRVRCPCHGSNFRVSGDVIAGPAPKPLYRVAVTELASGELLVDKSVLENRPGFRDKTPFVVQLETSAHA